MLCLLGEPSVSTKLLILFECSYEYGCAVIDSMASIRMLRHMRLAIQRAVTAPSVIAFSVVH